MPGARGLVVLRVRVRPATIRRVKCRAHRVRSMYAGVDLGATRCRATVADADGVELSRVERSTPRSSGIAVTECVLATLRAACEEAGVDPAALRATGIGSMGPLDLAAGTVEQPPNLPVERVPLRGPVAELVGGEVYLHNDTTAGVIGERYYGQRVPDDIVYLTISSGIGAGVAVDGRVLRGWDGNAGEVGHFVVDPDGRLTCGCGRPGHWEAYCAGENVPRFARLLAADRPEAAAASPLPLSPPFPVAGADGPTADEAAVFDPTDPDAEVGFEAAAVFAAAADGDEFATHVLDRVARLNAVGVTDVVHAFAPLVVFVGGAVALRNTEAVIEPIRERIQQSVITNVPEVRATTLGEDAVLKGALASALTGGTGE
jgi:glucokinase